VRVVPERVVGRGNNGGQRLTFGALLFEGHLRVIDGEKFLGLSLAKGIGPGKAYGFGLLSLAPV